MIINETLYRELSKEIPELEREIRQFYKTLDQKTGLHGSTLPITFGYETDVVGSFTRSDDSCFHFSLLFLGSCIPNPLSLSDRKDLYKHEYAHYMEATMHIPMEYRFRPGLHGSAWQYCCSLIGAAPTPYFEPGKGDKTYDYDRLLKKKPPLHPSAAAYRATQERKNKDNSTVKFQIGDTISHPKYGEGTIQDIKPLSSSVRLSVLFRDGLHTLDQTWLIRYQHGLH